jgi:cleavage stimulation factor subunit 1
MNAKRASRSLAEASPIRTVRFHPSGQFLLVGTDQPEIRMYDVKTLKCYASANVHSYHTGAINAVCMAIRGNEMEWALLVG